MTDVTRKGNLRDEIANRIKDHIVDNGLRPGDRLPTEHEFASRYGVSRISVREATRALGFLGIVDAAPRRGLSVGRVDMRRVSEFLGFHLAINDYPMEQLIETRIVIETGGLPHLCRRVASEPELCDRLDELNNQLREQTELSKWIEIDIQFHRTLLQSSGLNPLVAFNDLLEIFFKRFRESVRQGEWRSGIDSHQRIIDAIRTDNLQAACDELRQHIESHKTRMSDGNRE